MTEIEDYRQGKRPTLSSEAHMVSIDEAREIDPDLARAIIRELTGGISRCQLDFGISKERMTRGELYVLHDPAQGYRLVKYLSQKEGISFVGFNLPLQEGTFLQGFSCEGDDLEALVSIIKEVIVKQPDAPNFSSQVAEAFVRDMARNIVNAINSWLRSRETYSKKEKVRGVRIVSVRLNKKGRRSRQLEAGFLKKGLEIEGSLWAVLV